MSTLQLTINPQEFFREQLHDATQTLKIQIGEDLEFYLVNLLCDFIDPKKMREALGEIDPLDTPLAFMYQRGVEAPPQRQPKIFKSMGDTSLYVAGYFQDYFNRKIFDISYYMQMGRTAYARASRVLRERGGDDHLSRLFEDLSQGFEKWVELFAIVSDNSELSSTPTGTLELYDRWSQTGSERIRNELERRGISPIPVNKKQQ